MRYIKKLIPPDEFIEATKNFTRNTKWKRFKNPSKKITHKNILENEQSNLCAYCEIEIFDINNSHLEHIKPKADNKYPEDKFNYNNLIVSCEGKNCKFINPEEYDEDIHSCGHKKNNEYNETLFLNPTEILDLEKYFIFDRDGKIKPSNKDYEKTEETIKILNLDSKRLKTERENQLNAFDEYLLELEEFEAIQYLNDTLNLNQKNLPSFITFLRYIYKDLLNA